MHVVLIEPLIPQNTGSIARTCAAAEVPLHLVGRLGFEVTEKRVRRAGLDYWPYVTLKQHAAWDDYVRSEQPRTVWLLTKYAEQPYYRAEFKEGDALVFGSETKGLGDEFLARFPKEQQLLIPMRCAGVRSLNLSNAAAIVLYEALKQIGRI